MALTLPKPPEQGLDIIRTKLGSLVDHHTSVAYNMAMGGTENVDVAAPHRMYFIGLEDVANGHLLSAAEVTGWRYIIVRGDDPMAAAELGIDQLGGSLEFSQLNQGPFVSSTIEGVSIAADLDTVRNNNYELRLLKIPSLYIIALWLHSQGAQDIIIPIPPTRPELTPYDSYSEESFLQAIHEAAVKRLEFNEVQT
jgi:hypothetical protein